MLRREMIQKLPKLSRERLTERYTTYLLLIVNLSRTDEQVLVKYLLDVGTSDVEYPNSIYFTVCQHGAPLHLRHLVSHRMGNIVLFAYRLESISNHCLK